jgi:hypothetical protein
MKTSDIFSGLLLSGSGWIIHSGQLLISVILYLQDKDDVNARVFDDLLYQFMLSHIIFVVSYKIGEQLKYWRFFHYT